MPISSPSDIPNCQIYLDADAGSFSDAGSTPAVVGDLVQQLNDQSGNTRHATQATSGNRPTFTKINGVGALRFLDNHFLDTPSFFGSAYDTAFTEFIVLEHETAGFKVASGDLGAGFRHDVTGTGNTEQSQRFTPHLSATTEQSTLARQSNRIEVFRYDGTTKILRVASQDADNTFSIAATGNLGMAGGYRIGQYSGGGFGFAGFFRAAGAYSRSITGAEDDSLVAWALAKFTSSSNGALSSGSGNTLVVCDGNSLTSGGQNGSTPYPTQLGTLLGAGYTISNQGIPSVRIGHMLSDRFRTLNQIDGLWSASAKGNICVFFEGINDVTNAASGEESFQRTKEYGLRRKYKGYKVVVCTTPKAGVCTGTQETARQNLNTLVRANWQSFADGFADLDANAAFSDPNNMTYYQTDTIHFTTAGYAIVAGLVQGAIQSLPKGGLLLRRRRAAA